MSLQVQGLSYAHPDKDILFQNISFSISSGEKCAIIGNNGIGKSTSSNIKYIDNQLVTVIKIQMICKCKYKTI